MAESLPQCADFEITVPQIDIAGRHRQSDHRRSRRRVRMTGGGFGGCVVALIPEDLVPPFGRPLRNSTKRNRNQRNLFMYANRHKGAGQC